MPEPEIKELDGTACRLELKLERRDEPLGLGERAWLGARSSEDR